MNDQQKYQPQEWKSANNIRRPAYRLLMIFGLLFAALLTMACGLIPAVAAGNVDSYLLHWDELPKEFSPVTQTCGLDRDGRLAYEALFENRLPHTGDDLEISSKIVISDPQYWRVYLLNSIPKEYQTIDVAYGKEAMGFLTQIDRQKGVEILFLKGNAFVTVLVKGNDDAAAVELAKLVAEKLAIRLPDTIANPSRQTYTELKVDEAAAKRDILEIIFGKKNEKEIDTNLNLKADDDHTLCYKITPVKTPVKFTTAIVDTQTKTYMRKTDHYNPSSPYSGCETLHAFPGEYAFAVWYDDALVYYQPFFVNKP